MSVSNEYYIQTYRATTRGPSGPKNQQDFFLVSPSILPGLSVLGSAPGNPLTLECIVEAYPKPFVVWSFGGG